RPEGRRRRERAVGARYGPAQPPRRHRRRAARGGRGGAAAGFLPGAADRGGSGRSDARVGGTSGRSRAMSTAPDQAQLEALARALGARLEARGMKLVTAESCTGGWI